MNIAELFVRVGADVSGLRSGMAEAESELQRTGRAMQELGGTMTAAITLPLVGMGTAAVAAFTKQEDAVAKLDAVLRATGGVAGVTSDHVRELAASLQQSTRFGDEMTIAGAAVLLTFKSIRNELGEGNDVFDRTVRVGQDLSALLGGDLQSAMVMLGKAIEDPITGLTALRRVGVSFTEEEKETIKALHEAGDALGAQKLILQGLETQLGGTAQAMAETMQGQMVQAWNALGDAAEKVGAIIAPVLIGMAGLVSAAAVAFSGLDPAVQKTVVVVSALAAAVGPLLLAIGTIIRLLPTLQAGFAILSASAGPIALMTLAIIPLIAAGRALIENWDLIAYEVGRLVDRIREALLGRFGAIVEGVREKVEAMTGFFRDMYDKVVGNSYVPDMVERIGQEFTRMGGIFDDGTRAIADFAMGSGDAIKDFVEQALKDLTRLLIKMAALRIIQGVLGVGTGGVGAAIMQGVGFGSTLGSFSPPALGGSGTAATLLAAMPALERPLTPREAARDAWWSDFIRHGLASETRRG